MPNDPRPPSTIDVSGTSFRGYVTTSYADLVATFGEPNAPAGDYKTQVEWHLLTDTGDVVTICDYRQGACYRGDDDGIPFEQVTCWHIGGRTRAVVDWVWEQIDEESTEIDPKRTYGSKRLGD